MKPLPLLSRGSINQFTAELSGPAAAAVDGRVRSFAAAANATRSLQPAGLRFAKSPEERGLALKSLTLTEGFEGLLGNVFNATNQVYFISWAWDFGGEAPFLHPPSGTAPSSVLVPMKAGKVREFLGSGIVLFPARTISAGLAVRIMIWESDADVREFGKTLSAVSNAIKQSPLTNLLHLATLATGATMATVSAINAAALELADTVGKILQANSDDYVDYFEGYYPVSEPWPKGTETHSGNASTIELTRL